MALSFSSIMTVSVVESIRVNAILNVIVIVPSKCGHIFSTLPLQKVVSTEI